MRIEIRDETVLPRRVVPQPTPNRNPGGDCVACCVAGATGLDVEEVYAIARKAAPATEAGRWTTGYCALDDEQVRSILFEARHRGLVERWIDDVPIWPWSAAPAWGARTFLTFGMPGHLQHSGWFGYIRLALQAGYYALGGVDSARGGPTSMSDHWVMICGARERWEFREDGCGSGRDEVLISCSARSTPAEEWVSVSDVLGKRGMFAVLLVRPTAGGSTTAIPARTGSRARPVPPQAGRRSSADWRRDGRLGLRETSPAEVPAIARSNPGHSASRVG